jgi:hypothetical protein
MNTYAYRAYIETLLSYGVDAKTSQLTSALFYKDEAGKMDKPNPLAANAADRNSGLASRQTFSAESHEIDMIGRIHTDICFQDRYMLNEVNAKIKLIRSQDAFLSYGHRSSTVQSRRDRGVVIGAQSQNQPFRVFGTRENPRKRDGEIPYSTRDLQIVYNSGRVLGRQSRKTVFGPVTDQVNRWARRQ